VAGRQEPHPKGPSQGLPLLQKETAGAAKKAL
jgi:hypothetical protein